MHNDTPNLIEIVTHTPSWVWLILALLIWRGARSTRARVTDMRGLLLMPIIITALSVYNLVSGGFSLAAVLGLAIGLVGGIWAGRQLEDRHPASLVGRGQLMLPGEWTTMITILVVFSLRYASGALAVTAPTLLRNPGVHMFSVAVTVFFATTLVTRMALRLAILRHAEAAA